MTDFSLCYCSLCAVADCKCVFRGWYFGMRSESRNPHGLRWRVREAAVSWSSRVAEPAYAPPASLVQPGDWGRHQTASLHRNFPVNLCLCVQVTRLFYLRPKS